ncbi:hypothetical protein F4679DRAFT_403745 [Xylaria curta]|nr:hypothetical protein F4679DRAFT_403745 [Xylaria curta]
MNDQSAKDEDSKPELYCLICRTRFQPRDRHSVTCSAECLDSRRQQRGMIIALSDPLHCVICGTLFQPRSHNSISCSDPDCKFKRRAQTMAECQKIRNRLNRSTKVPSQIDCSKCGEPFKPTRLNNLTCSKDECQSRRRQETNESKQGLIAFTCENCKRTFHSATHTQMCDRLECQTAKEMQLLEEDVEERKQLADSSEAGRYAVIAPAPQAQAPADNQVLRQDLRQQPETNRTPFRTTQPIPGSPHHAPTLRLYPWKEAQVQQFQQFQQFQQSNQPQLAAASYYTMTLGLAFPEPVLLPSSYLRGKVRANDQQGQQSFLQEYSEVLPGSISPGDPSFTSLNDTGQDVTVDTSQQLPIATGSYLSGEVLGSQNVPPDEMEAQEFTNSDPKHEPHFQGAPEMAGQQLMNLDPWNDPEVWYDAEEWNDPVLQEMIDRVAQELLDSNPRDDPNLQDAPGTASQQSMNPGAWDGPVLRGTVERAGQRSINLDWYDTLFQEDLP